jgi:hypothetical protein
MKKIALLWIFLMWGIILSGCNNTDEVTPQDNGDKIAHENNLIIEWVTPTDNIPWESRDGYLVAREIFEDHSDVVSFAPWTWESNFESENDYLPWNTIYFKWEVEGIDAAAWTHYYDAVAIDELKVIAYPTKEEVLELTGRYNYCETDSDCVDFYPGCPLGCSTPVNKEYKDIFSKITENFRNKNEPQCEYKCIAPAKITCENYKCTAVYEENQATEESDLSKAEIQEANAIFSK